MTGNSLKSHPSIHLPNTQLPPLVSIGLPVYNGETTLREALDSLLEQDYMNTELIISDNASTDGTERICLEYAARDARVRYYRNERNIGASENFNRVVDLSVGKYFTWAADDDWRHPSHIRKCVELLERNPRAVLCSTGFTIHDESGVKRVPAHNFIHAPSENVAKRVYQLLSYDEHAISMYGVNRTDLLRQIARLKPVWGSDVLCLHGSILAVPEVLFSYRRNSYGTLLDVVNNLAPGGLKPRWPLLLYKDLYVEVLRTVLASDLPHGKRWRASMAAGFALSKHWGTWIKISLTERARLKYLEPALERLCRGEKTAGLALLLGCILSTPVYTFSPFIWRLIAETAFGKEFVAPARRLFRGVFRRS
jgi:glycosyltransferase involved in cell wall biosynthesis